MFPVSRRRRSRRAEEEVGGGDEGEDDGERAGDDEHEEDVRGEAAAGQEGLRGESHWTVAGVCHQLSTDGHMVGISVAAVIISSVMMFTPLLGTAFVLFSRYRA